MTLVRRSCFLLASDAPRVCVLRQEKPTPMPNTIGKWPGPMAARTNSPKDTGKSRKPSPGLSEYSISTAGGFRSRCRRAAHTGQVLRASPPGAATHPFEWRLVELLKRPPRPKHSFRIGSVLKEFMGIPFESNGIYGNSSRIDPLATQKFHFEWST